MIIQLNNIIKKHNFVKGENNQSKDFVIDLRNKFIKKIKNQNKKEGALFYSTSQEKDLNQCTVEEILPHLLVNSSMAAIESKEKIWVAASMLVRFLTSFTNNLVVMESENPVGMIGSREVLQGLYENPTHDFFSEHHVYEIMNKDLHITSQKTRVSDLLKKMSQNGRDFALVQTTDGEFSTISARRLLEVGIMCNTKIRVSDVPSKKIVTFQREDTIEHIMMAMLNDNIDILVLENTPFFVTPQTIFEKIDELSYLNKIDGFLNHKANTLRMKSGLVISDTTTVPDMCKIMLSMRHTFVMTQNNVLTPWDLITTLA